MVLLIKFLSLDQIAADHPDILRLRIHLVCGKKQSKLHLIKAFSKLYYLKNLGRQIFVQGTSSHCPPQNPKFKGTQLRQQIRILTDEIISFQIQIRRCASLHHPVLNRLQLVGTVVVILFLKERKYPEQEHRIRILVEDQFNLLCHPVYIGWFPLHQRHNIQIISPNR